MTDKWHGRLERQEVRTSGELEGYSDFPGLKQVAAVKKEVVRLKTGEVSESTWYGVTSLCAEQAGAERLLRLMRGHWGIENGLFHAKDDSFGEDRRVFRSHRSHRSGTAASLLRACCEPQHQLAAGLLPLVEALRASDRPCSAGLCQPLAILQGMLRL